MRTLSFTIILTLLLFSCNSGDEKSVPEKPDPKADTVAKDTLKVTPVDSNELALRLENFLKVYELNGGGGVLSVDSTVTDTLIHVRYTTLPKNPQAHDKPYLWFEIYDFDNDSLATEFYNDLKTMEMVADFGIDKRPKNLFLNGHLVIFHHMEHSYGHNYQKYIENFNSVIHLDRSAQNLDSIVGFTYCNCRHEKADLSPLLGKWKVRFISKIHQESEVYLGSYTDTTTFSNSQPLTLHIEKDKVTIDDVTTAMRNPPSGMELPDSYYYMKYAFSSNYYKDMPKDTLLTYFYPEFLKEMEKIQKKKLPVSDYSFNLDIRVYPQFFRLSDKSVYMTENNRLYRLTR